MRAGRLFAALAVTILLTACAREARPVEIAAARIIIRNEVENPPAPSMLAEISPAAGRVTEEAVAYKASRASPGCRLKDRFDRKHVIAYHFTGGQSRVGLDVDMDGFNLRDAGDLELEAVTVNFRYRFQPIEKQKEKCLYRSSWQGLFGSGYNEFFVRENDTVYEQIDDEWDRFDDELEKYF